MPGLGEIILSRLLGSRQSAQRPVESGASPAKPRRPVRVSRFVNPVRMRTAAGDLPVAIGFLLVQSQPGGV